jgi:REP element-mobilizing transposase RayT
MPKKIESLKIVSRGYLPHWLAPGAIYSVTFRLDDSLPQHVILRLREHREALTRLITGGREPTAHERSLIRERFARELDYELDRGMGACHLRYPAIADVVEGSLQHFDGLRYELFAWCVMPNHVHVLVRTDDLPATMFSWKSYTGLQANRILGREGSFWQREYFDRIIRDQRDFVNTRAYVLNNPARAELQGWRWVGARPMDCQTIAFAATHAGRMPADRPAGSRRSF